MMEQDHEDFDNEQPLLEGYAQDMDSVQTTQARLPGDGAVTMAEKLAKHVGDNDMPLEKLPAKRIKLDSDIPPTLMERQRGVAPIKSEYLVYPSGTADSRGSRAVVDDDAAEQGGHQDSQASSKRKIKNKGQNKNRSFGISTDAIELCGSRATQPEFSPEDCRFGEKCKFEHDLRRYLKEGKRSDLTTLGGVCPVWNTQGKCDTGWKCRFVGSHMEERECDDGRKELVLIEDEKRQAEAKQLRGGSDSEIVNLVGTEKKMLLTRKKISTPKSDKFLEWLERSVQDLGKDAPGEDRQNTEDHNHTEVVEEPNGEADVNRADSRASYIEPPLLPSEKRRVYFGADTPILAPLTTQGNLPFRRLCVELGAQVTYSEMAMGLPILQGQKSEWALMKAHVSEISPPSMKMPDRVVADYDNSRDMKFGAQIASNKVWQAVRTTEVLTSLCPHLRVVDLNCGCPIDLVYRTGGGSGLLDSPAKLEKMLRGMNTVSGEVPITAKIRTGTKDGKPTAQRLVERLILGGEESHAMGSGPSGVAAITLHGRTRQQRYTKSADWSYIADCAALIKSLQEKADSTADTIKEPDARLQSASGRADRGHVYFIGNGDCYSHVDYLSHLNEAHVDSVMVGRGALVKPWLFEEISTGQYIDKSATERLEYVERFVRYGLQTWGSDEMGIGLTRRFLLEWLNFTHRYVPIGLLEHLPPNLQDRAPTFRGRNELETLLASDNYKDWIKISEIFLGPATEGFKFVPKHKSKSYEIEAEG